MKPTRIKILELMEQYLNDKNYRVGFITSEWVEKITNELNLKNLDNTELCNMWDMVYLTISHEALCERLNGNWNEYDKYKDVESAFTEVVNIEARKRK